MSISFAAGHRAAAALCDAFPSTTLLVSISSGGLVILVPATVGEVEERIAAWSLVTTLVGAKNDDRISNGKDLRATGGSYNGIHVISVVAPGVLETSLDDCSAARLVNAANDKVNRKPFGSLVKRRVAPPRDAVTE